LNGASKLRVLGTIKARKALENSAQGFNPRR
jgi:hypothetical protein